MFPAAEDSSGVRLSARVASLTDVGRKRRNNEDNFIVCPLNGSPAAAGDEEHTFGLESPGLLMVVADGMGGHFGGEVASRLGVEDLVLQFLQKVQNPEVPPADPQDILRQAVEAAHKTVYAHSQAHNENLTMGTTLTAVWLIQSWATIAQVGDSRAYLFRDGNLVLLTQDQTIGNLLQSRGEESMMIGEEVKEMLTQALGAQPDIEVVTSAVELQQGDRMLLCSDGLYKLVPPEVLVECLEASGDASLIAGQLISRANENGGRDNITAILAEIRAA